MSVLALRPKFGLGLASLRWILSAVSMEILLLPNWMLARLALTPAQRNHLNAFASVLLAVAAAPLIVRIPHVCLFRYFLHIPCPGCGVTHALLAIERLDLPGAYRANTGGILVAAFFAFQIVARPVALFADRAERTIARLSRFGSTVTVSTLVLVWIWRLIAA